MRTPTDSDARRSAITPLERVIILAVTATIGTAAYSAYRTSAVRAQVAEGVAVAHTLAPIVTRSFSKHREFHVDDEIIAALERARTDSTFIASVTVIDGRIDVVFGGSADAAIAGRHLSLTPHETADLEVVWVCGNDEPGPGLNPLGFASGGRRARALAATIEARHLPAQCR